MTAKTFVGLVNQPNQASGQDANQPMAGWGRARYIIWRIDAFLWLALTANILCIALENQFGVFSGATLLMGAAPAMVLAAAMIFGGAAVMMSQGPAAVAWLRTVHLPKTTATAFASETPRAEAFDVRTAPRTTAQYQSRAARRVMEATV